MLTEGTAQKNPACKTTTSLKNFVSHNCSSHHVSQIFPFSYMLHFSYIVSPTVITTEDTDQFGRQQVVYEKTWKEIWLHLYNPKRNSIKESLRDPLLTGKQNLIRQRSQTPLSGVIACSREVTVLFLTSSTFIPTRGWHKMFLQFDFWSKAAQLQYSVMFCEGPLPLLIPFLLCYFFAFPIFQGKHPALTPNSAAEPCLAISCRGPSFLRLPTFLLLTPLSFSGLSRGHLAHWTHHPFDYLRNNPMSSFTRSRIW